MNSTPLANNATHLVVQSSSALAQARSEYMAASQAHKQAVALWHKRIIYAQCLVAGLLFIRWLWGHSLLGAAFMSLLVLCVLTVFHVFVGLLTRADKKRLVAAQSHLAKVRKNEVESYLTGLNQGRYQWIQRGGDYLALLADAGLLYYFGSVSKDQHVLLEPQRTVLQVSVAAEQHVSERTITKTTHGRRPIFMPSQHIGILGKGTSKTETTTQTSVTTTYTLDIQIQLASGQQPVWITLPFGLDGKGADNWKTLVSQLK